LLYDGRRKNEQGAHLLVVDIDVGNRDLQQCADAVMRLWAEYQHSAQRGDDICFRFVSGDAARWSKYRQGIRAEVNRRGVRWSKAAPADSSYGSFRRYLDLVFSYASTRSLARDVPKVSEPLQVQPGDFFLQGGSPGHAVLVVDVAQDERGRRVFALAQSYMPAQQIHVLKNPANGSAWYPARAKGPLSTPEWRFDYRDLRRFSGSACP